MTLKLGGEIGLSADERSDSGDGLTCLLQFLSKGALVTVRTRRLIDGYLNTTFTDDCEQCLATSLRTYPLGR